MSTLRPTLFDVQREGNPLTTIAMQYYERELSEWRREASGMVGDCLKDVMTMRNVARDA